MIEEILKCENINFSYPPRKILSNVSFILSKGEIGVILGQSGCGKTTLLRIIAGLEKRNTGNISIKEKIVKSDSEFVPPQNRKIGYVFQDYALFPNLTVVENITFGLQQFSKSDKIEVLAKMLNIFKLEPEKNKYPHQLSGGQQQRVAIARSLAPSPEILLMDEPFSNLDLRMRGELILELSNIFKKLQITSLVVTHEVSEAFSFADKMGILQNGELLQWANPETIFKAPSAKKIVDILQSGNLLEGQILQGKINTILGAIESIKIPNTFIDGQKCYLFLPHGDIEICEGGKYQCRIEKLRFTGKNYNIQIEYSPNLFFSILENANFCKKNNEVCHFNINFKNAVVLPHDGGY